MLARVGNLVEFKTPFRGQGYGFVTKVVAICESTYQNEKAGRLIYFVEPIGTSGEISEEMIKDEDILEVYIKEEKS